MRCSSVSTLLLLAVPTTSASGSPSRADGASLQNVFAVQTSPSTQNWIEGSNPCAGWKGVSCVPEDESVLGGVTHLDVVDFKLSGAVEWAALVSMAALREVAMVSNSLSGPLNLGHLPTNLRKLEVADNKFSGAVDLTTLPAGMTHLRMEYNDLTGTVDFTKLPQTMRNLFLFGNKFTGHVDVTQLPPTLVFFDMSTNQFTGTVDLTALPQSLETFHFNHNAFTGAVNLRHLPESLQDIDMSSNKLTGTLDLRELPADLAAFTALENEFSRINFPSTLPTNLKVFTLEPTAGWGTPRASDTVCFIPTTAALDVSHLRRGEETDVPAVMLRTMCQWAETRPTEVAKSSDSPMVFSGNMTVVGVSEWRLPMRISQV